MERLSTATRRTGFLLVVSAVLGLSVIAAPRDDRQTGRVSAAPATAGKPESAPVRFTADGALLQPAGYREWMHVGTPLTPNDMNGGQAPFPEFHSVYINPAAYRHYQETGEFPDGTVLVKVLIGVGGKEATSGKGYFMGEFTGLEVSIKDKRRFKDEPGNWAYFSFGHKYPLKTASVAQPAVNCNDCHMSSAADDFVFTQYYPVMRAAKGSGRSE